ncbi:hypothetical protein ACA086_14695, partial [Muriicola sp. E247]|uniref:hypothetical protein n=1 Tax=Muriicola sp. E247 TaxID=3242730 RepID=UPI003526B5DD
SFGVNAKLRKELQLILLQFLTTPKSAIIGNGLGYDLGASLKASFVLAFLHFAEKISLGKSEPWSLPYSCQFLVLNKCRNFQVSSKTALDYSRC